MANKMAKKRRLILLNLIKIKTDTFKRKGLIQIKLKSCYNAHQNLNKEIFKNKR